ncbi:MAG: fluoride efflux transporter CrcB, partial [Dehalococcoidia bacterium]|nr:fluoride efflux transporter CrcB [Dehalococcoidia bacterium]
ARLGGSGTLAVNVIGAFGLGVLLGLIEARYPSMPRAVSVGIASGVFGGFTTFSSYMADVVAHAEAGRIAVAASLLAATAILGMLAMVAGLAAGRAA